MIHHLVQRIIMPEVRIGDITEVVVDGIVNAAKPSLLGGGGVDGAIHAVAAHHLKNACSKLGGCIPGKAVITDAYDLPAKHVIHTVPPRYGHCGGNENKILRSCYIESLLVAKKHNLKSIAFPSLGTGVYGFPKISAAQIATQTVLDFLSQGNNIQVLFIVVSEQESELYLRTLGEFGF